PWALRGYQGQSPWLVSSLDQKALLIGLPIDQEAHVRRAHLLPALTTVVNPRARVGVVLVGCRVVVRELYAHSGALRDLHRGTVCELPVEFVVGHVEECLSLSVRIHERVADRLSADVGVRPEPDE